MRRDDRRGRTGFHAIVNEGADRLEQDGLVLVELDEVLRFFRLTPTRRRCKLRGKFGGAFGAHCASVSGQG